VGPQTKLGKIGPLKNPPFPTKWGDSQGPNQAPKMSPIPKLKRKQEKTWGTHLWGKPKRGNLTGETTEKPMKPSEPPKRRRKILKKSPLGGKKKVAQNDNSQPI